LEQLTHTILAFIGEHAAWAYLVIGLVAFAESFAFFSLIFPGTAILIAAGVLVGSGTLELWPLAAAAALGAALGDAISYWIGLRFGHVVPRVWPFSRHPEMLDRGTRFFSRHGGKSVFIGRFFGPVRAVIPLAAGMMRMPVRRFYVANVLSAVIWAPALLAPGALASRWLETNSGSAVVALLEAHCPSGPDTVLADDGTRSRVFAAIAGKMGVCR
jgi:membrane protein DedA with SNARE-associated domain